jgi:hypothetical protein
MDFIFKMEIREVSFPKKFNWLSEWDDDDLDEDDFPTNEYELYFGRWEEMSTYIDAITKGFKQYWADVYFDIYNNNNERLEYHNGSSEWDKEIHISTSRIYLDKSFWKAIEQHKESD